MKKLALLFVLGFMVTGVTFAQTNKKDVKFVKVVHDFGAVKESVGFVTTDFEFKNAGKAPVVITGAQASCGCTTPSYTKEPVVPGKKGVITARYSTTGRPGNFNKTISIYTNIPDTVYVLTIKGNVIQ